MGAPLLDNQFTGHNHLVRKLAQSLPESVDAAKDVINSIAERDIYTGGQVEVVIVSKDGISFKREWIRKD